MKRPGSRVVKANKNIFPFPCSAKIERKASQITGQPSRTDARPATAPNKRVVPFLPPDKFPPVNALLSIPVPLWPHLITTVDAHDAQGCIPFAHDHMATYFASKNATAIKNTCLCDILLRPEYELLFGPLVLIAFGMFCRCGLRCFDCRFKGTLLLGFVACDDATSSFLESTFLD